MKKFEIYLAGGGTRCVFQIPIIKEILQECEITKIRGISMGAIVGYAAIFNCYDQLYNFLKDIGSSLIPSFSFYGIEKYINKIPILSHLYNIFYLSYSVKNKGFYNSENGKQFINLIDKYATQNYNNKQELLSKLDCVVFNVTKNKIQIINGTHPLFREYLIASCSIWLLLPPVKIKKLKSECECNDLCFDYIDELYCNCLEHMYNEYIDVGFIQTIPELSSTSTTKIVILTKNLNQNTLSTGNNIFEYLSNVINYCSNKISQDNFIINKNCIYINYNSPSEKANEFDKMMIDKFKKDGDNVYENIIKYANPPLFIDVP